MTEPVNQDMVSRPETMTRQMQRRLYRFSCRHNGTEPKFKRPTDKKIKRKLRKQTERKTNDLLPRNLR